MNDRWEYTIPANTAEASAIRVKCRISPGVLRTLIIYFPPGCQNLARCRVHLGEKPIAPRSPKNYIAADSMAHTLLHVDEQIREDLSVLNWDVWNLDDTNPHTLWMAAEWSSEAETPEKKTAGLMDRFVKKMEDLIGI